MYTQFYAKNQQKPTEYIFYFLQIKLCFILDDAPFLCHQICLVSLGNWCMTCSCCRCCFFLFVYITTHQSAKFCRCNLITSFGTFFSVLRFSVCVFVGTFFWFSCELRINWHLSEHKHDLDRSLHELWNFLNLCMSRVHIFITI